MYKAKFNKQGNIKVGAMWTFNKLAGSGEIAGCKGTCGEYCKGCYNKENPQQSSCYVFKSYVRYGWEKSTVVNGHIRNTNIVRNNIDQAFEELHLQIKRAKKKPSVIRVHSSGEIETAEELIKWNELAAIHPEVTFYIYTKNFGVIDILLNNKKLSNNFFINFSIWHELGIKEFLKWNKMKNIRAFVYDDGFDYAKAGLKINCKCPAYLPNGKLIHDKTCAECKICFQSKARVCSCYAH